MELILEITGNDMRCHEKNRYEGEDVKNRIFDEEKICEMKCEFDR
jgi:hypothetical protein